MQNAPDGYVVTVGEATRNLEQNALLHSLISRISHDIEWVGKKWDAETWKRLLTAAWLRSSGENVTMLPALDGVGVDIVFRRTSNLSKAECSDLIEYIYAWGADNGIDW